MKGKCNLNDLNLYFTLSSSLIEELQLKVKSLEELRGSLEIKLENTNKQLTETNDENQMKTKNFVSFSLLLNKTFFNILAI